MMCSIEGCETAISGRNRSGLCNKHGDLARQRAYYERNREARSAASRAYYAANKDRVLSRLAERNRKLPDVRRAQRLKTRYGFSVGDFESLLLSQGQRCAICFQGLLCDKKTHLDHDHSCCPGIRSCGSCVRAILCADCNHVLGRTKENPDVLRRAAEYVESFRDR